MASRPNPDRSESDSATPTSRPTTDSLDAVAEEVSTCHRCPRLVAWREKVATEKRTSFSDQEYWGRGVPSFGDAKAGIVVIGLAPAAHGANRTGRMFTGDRSGDWLYRALYRAGLANQPTSVDRDDGLELTGVLVTSPVKCAPPANKPTTQERDRCARFLIRELDLVEPAVFVVLGAFAYQALCRYLGSVVPKPRPKFGHGVEVELSNGRTIVCSYHVSQQNTFTGRLTEDMLDTMFARAVELAGPGS